jgi:hypothetical protein
MIRVGDLRQYLLNLIGLLNATGGKGPAGDLERLHIGLEPFAELTLGEFTAFLAQADEYRRTGAIQTGRSGRPRGKPTADAEKIQQALQRIQALYEGATDPGLQYDAIDAEIKRLEEELSKEEGLELARGFGIIGTFKSKSAALQEVARKIADRKAVHERTKF